MNVRPLSLLCLVPALLLLTAGAALAQSVQAPPAATQPAPKIETPEAKETFTRRRVAGACGHRQGV